MRTKRVKICADKNGEIGPFWIEPLGGYARVLSRDGVPTGRVRAASTCSSIGGLICPSIPTDTAESSDVRWTDGTGGRGVRTPPQRNLSTNLLAGIVQHANPRNMTAFNLRD